MASDRRRRLPSVDLILRSEPGARAASSVGRAVLKREVARAIEEYRAEVEAGAEVPIADEILARAAGRASRIVRGLTPVINATGVVVHTNLGRAPLADAAVRAVTRVARGYSDLEVDRDSGRRGTRSGRAEALLATLTGAEAALVVNNGAAALMVALAALAKGKQVLVSRGELIEIGGEFRIPDIMRASGARLVEVGTTNRTRIADYRGAATDRLGAILKVHPSNYRVVGFTASTTTKDLAALARANDVPLIYDVGSGLLDTERGFPGDEPSMREALEQGADLVLASGDKLLGGPQAGCVVGRADLVARLRTHPIARAVRVDKLQIAALEATLALHARGEHGAVPVHHMLHASADVVGKRAHLLAETIGGDLEGAHVVHSEAVVGGGSMPGAGLASWAVEMKVADPPAFAARLRTGAPSVFCRMDEGRVLLDCRTVTDEQVHDLARAVHYALEADDIDDD